MPSTITHAYFSNEVYDKIGNKFKKIVNREMLKTFGQGPDVLFFYNIINLKKGKKIRDFGKYMQKHNTQDFFVNLISYIKDNKYEYKDDIMSLLYGFISHYVLDKTVHPFVIHKAGVYKRKNKDTYKYNSLHGEMETYIDYYLISKNENVDPKEFKTYNFCFNIGNFSYELNKTINYTFKKTYEIENMAKIYNKSIKQMKIFYKIFRYDPIGVKRGIYSFLDMIFPRFFLKKEPLSYNMRTKNKDNYLNLNRSTWNHPKDINEKYNYSFDDLYNMALKETLDIIDSVNNVIYNNDNVDKLYDIFPNLSYTSGKDCNTKLKTKYFEF